MNSLKTILMSSVAAISLAGAPAIAQQSTTETPAADAQMMQAAPAERSYDSVYGDRFADWGDRNVGELIGTIVINDAGETIGEIDNFGLTGDQLVAIIGVGGFLGMGEHEVAVPIDKLTVDGDQLLLAGVTREQLEAMPEYDEADNQTFAEDQTLRTGYETPPMAGATTGAAMDTAAVKPSDNPANDQPMANASEDVAEAAEEAGQDLKNAANEAAEEIAEAGDAVAKKVDRATESAQAEISEETDQMAADSNATQEPMASDNKSVDVGAAEDTMAKDTDMAATDSETGWTDEMDTIFADIADRQITDLIGMEVAGADGEVVGEVDNFALQGQDVVAIVGVGGFLGIGEHDVALPLGDMTYDGERLVLSSLTEDQLRDMPEYDDTEANYLPEEGTLRSSYAQ